VTPEGQRVLGPAVAPRRAQARFMIALTGAAGAVTLLVAANASANPALIPGALILVAITGLLGWGAAWLARGRIEWRIGSGRIVRQKRFGATLRETFVAARLELTTTSDSDGDRWYHLDALGRGTATDAAGSSASPPNRTRIASAMNDPVIPRTLGGWLARETGVPFADLATPEARTKEILALRAQLQVSGPLGRILAGWIDRATDSEKRRAS
jgi:hypothetical protein